MKKFSKIVENHSEKLTKDILEDYLQEMVDSGVQIYITTINPVSGVNREAYFVIHLYKYCVSEISPFKELSELYDMFDEFLNRVGDISNRFDLNSDLHQCYRWGSAFPFDDDISTTHNLRGVTFKYSIRIYTKI